MVLNGDVLSNKRNEIAFAGTGSRIVGGVMAKVFDNKVATQLLVDTVQKIEIEIAGVASAVIVGSEYFCRIFFEVETYQNKIAGKEMPANNRTKIRRLVEWNIANIST